MDTGFDHCSICLGDYLQRLVVLSGNHFSNRFEAVLLVARIDPFGRVAEREILAAAQPGCGLQNRRALFLYRAWIEGRFEHYDIAALEKSAYRLCCTKNRGEIGPPRSVDRGRHGDDEKI